jgi:endonuclease I
MKQIYILFLLITSISFAQIPSGYYDSAIGTGYTLKTQLYNIINGHSDLGYSGLYTTYLTSDIDSYFEMNGTMLDMYSEKPSGIDSYEYTYGTNQDNGTGGTFEGDKYNREHIIPQSVFSSAFPMRSDAHFVVPSDKFVNAQRSNFPFGVVDTPNWTSTNGSQRGNNLNSGYSAGYSGTVFEPIDEFKGDIARMFFYFATRYENNVDSWSYSMFDGSSDQVFNITFLNILYTWHIQDPVSTREIDRNNAIYNRQNNRNPFIDDESYVFTIWGNLLSTNQFETISYKMFPNPVKDDFVYFSSTQDLDIIIYDVLGKQVLIENIDNSKNYIDVTNLNKGIYIVRINSIQGTTTKKLIKQ